MTDRDRIDTESAEPGESGRIWRRRFVNLLLFLVLAASSWAVIGFRLHWKLYSLPSQSMMPTLQKGDSFIADKRLDAPLQRGDVVVFHVGGAPNIDYVKRIAGLPGDRIAMRGGTVFIYGTAVPQLPSDPLSYTDDIDGAVEGKTLTEQFPGEVAAHRVIDLERSVYDDVKEQTIPADQYFMLGDNRDRSADSRIPVRESGSGLVARADIVARAHKIYWSDDHARIGQVVR
jgi:signal peptidase I